MYEDIPLSVVQIVFACADCPLPVAGVPGVGRIKPIPLRHIEPLNPSGEAGALTPELKRCLDNLLMGNCFCRVN